MYLISLQLNVTKEELPIKNFDEAKIETFTIGRIRN